jgi:hypothetical protein
VYQKLSNDKQHEYDKNNPDIIDINDIRDTLSVRQKRIKLACDAITDRRNFNGKFDIPIILSQN